jgi:hypothetical protein
VLIAELYEALDELAERAESNTETFAEDGDLSALSNRLSDIGSRAYTLATGVDQVISGLKFDS